MLAVNRVVILTAQLLIWSVLMFGYEGKPDHAISITSMERYEPKEVAIVCNIESVREPDDSKH